jgi:hypothetical protein
MNTTRSALPQKLEAKIKAALVESWQELTMGIYELVIG